MSVVHTQKGFIITACEDCDHIMKSDTKKKRQLMERLHKRVCPKTGRSYNGDEGIRKFGEQEFKKTFAYSVSLKRTLRVNEKSTHRNREQNGLDEAEVLDVTPRLSKY